MQKVARSLPMKISKWLMTASLPFLKVRPKHKKVRLLQMRDPLLMRVQIKRPKNHLKVKVVTWL